MGVAEQRLTKLLQSMGLITPEQEGIARLAAGRERGGLADALVASRAVSRGDILPILEEIYGVPFVDLTVTFGDPLILDVLPREKAYQMEALPLFLIDKQLTIAVADPDDLARLDDLRSITGKQILPVVALGSDLRRCLGECYGVRGEHGAEVIAFDVEPDEAPLTEVNLESATGDAPVVRLLNLILMRAVEERASDIHLEPGERQAVVRYRIDGLLRVKPYAIPTSALPALTSRIKILANMDIAEKRLPQDGKIRLRYATRGIDVRVSTLPTIRDEKCVMRLLDKDRVQPSLDQLGMLPDVLRAWKQAVRAHQGVVLVTGPTGSGKSSTLFATLRYLHRPEVNIVTLEDPVEYEIDGLCQSQINERAGFTFARGLRSILRQDPDIILVGEIRDAETAQIAAQAALTGHLVLASLHTNNAPSAITRLVDIGVPAYLISGALVAVLAQRLVRRACPDCLVEAEPSREERQFLGHWLEKAPFLEGRGCPACQGSGFRGRMAVHEIVEVTESMRTLISLGAAAPQITAEAVRQGYRSIWRNGLTLVAERVTTLRELARVVEVDRGETEAKEKG